MTATVPENEFGFHYAGVHSREFNIRVIEIHRNATGTMTEETQDIPGMRGDLYLGVDERSKPIPVDIEIVADSHEQRNELVHQIAEWLKPVEDNEFELIFDDEQDFVYYAHVSNIAEITRSLYKGRTTITFTCSDPKAYGEYISQEITENPATIMPDGIDECYPIFTCIPQKDESIIAVSDEEGNYVYIGEDVDPDTGAAPIDKEPRILHDNCNTLANWDNITSSNITFELENGVVSGSAKSTANTLRVNSFGSHVSGKWHGPVLQQMLTESCPDYRIKVRMLNNQYYARAHGKIEVYLLDANAARIGKLMLKDNSNSKTVYAQVEIGSHTTHHEIYYGEGTVKKGKKDTKTIKTKNGTYKTKVNGKTKTVQKWKTIKLDEDLTTDTFTNFFGSIQLQKIGNKYSIEIMKLDIDTIKPLWSKPITATWADTNGTYNKALAGVAVYMAKYDITEDTTDPVTSYKNNDLALTDLQVWNIIDGGNSGSTEPTVIVRAGDEIKINCEDHTVYKNGDIFMENVYIGSNFLTMQGGIMKTFAFSPDIRDAEWYMEYRPTKP